MRNIGTMLLACTLLLGGCTQIKVEAAPEQPLALNDEAFVEQPKQPTPEKQPKPATPQMLLARKFIAAQTEPEAPLLAAKVAMLKSARPATSLISERPQAPSTTASQTAPQADVMERLNSLAMAYRLQQMALAQCGKPRCMPN